MSIDLPAAVRSFIDSTNAADSDGFVAAFTEDASLNDWGRVFHGHDGVRSWNRTDNIGVRAHFDLVGAEAGQGENEYIVTLKVTGDGYNGTGPMRFTVRDGLISELVIS